MGVSIIDGRVEAAQTKRENKNFTQFSTLRFVGSDGREQTIKNAVAATPIARELRPGNTGRFYLFSSIDMRGVYAVRDPAGAVVRAFPGQNEKLGLIGMALAVAAILLFEFFGDGTPVIALIALVLGAIGYFFSRRTRIEAEQAFEKDNRATASSPIQG